MRLSTVTIALLTVGCAAGTATAATYTWNGGGAGAWGTRTSWTPPRDTPAASDVLVFSGGGAIAVAAVPTQTIGRLVVSNGTAVTMTAQAVSGRLTIGGLAGTDVSVDATSQLNTDDTGGGALLFFLASGANASIAGRMTFTGTREGAGINGVDSAAVVFTSGAACVQACPGTLFHLGPTPNTANSIVFEAGATFRERHSAFSSPFALAAPQAKVLFKPGSRYVHETSAPPDVANRTYADLEFNFPSPHVMPGNTHLTVDTMFLAAGSVTLSGSIILRGDLRASAALQVQLDAARPTSLRFAGSALQRIGLAAPLAGSALDTVQIANPAGISLTRDLVCSGGPALRFESGRLRTNGAMLWLTSSSSVLGASRQTGWVDGVLRRTVPTSGPLEFAVGDSATYAPAVLQFNGLTTSFDLMVSTNGGGHPALGSSPVDSTRAVNRSWTLRSPDPPPPFVSYSVELAYADSDRELKAHPEAFRIALFQSGGWSTLATGARAATWTRAGGATALGDLVVGEAPETYRWTAGSSGNWSSAANWAPARTIPLINDRMRFEVPGAYQVFGVGPDTVGQIHLASAVLLELQGTAAPPGLCILGDEGPDLAVPGSASLALKSQSGGPFFVRMCGGATSEISGTLSLDRASLDAEQAGAIVFQAGALCRHGPSPSYAFDGTGAARVVEFRAGSTCEESCAFLPYNDPVRDGAGVVKARFDARSRLRFVAGGVVRFAADTLADLELAHPQITTLGCPARVDSLLVTAGAFALPAGATLLVQGSLVTAPGASLGFGPGATLKIVGDCTRRLALSSPPSTTASATLRSASASGAELTEDLVWSSGTLSLTQGVLRTGGHRVTLGPGAQVLGAGPATGWVAGELEQWVPASDSVRFDVGTVDGYAPVTVRMIGSSSTARMAARAHSGDHPDASASCISTNASLNQFWTLSSGDAPTFSALALSLVYDPTQLDPGVVAEQLQVYRRAGLHWSMLDTRTPVPGVLRTEWSDSLGVFIAGDPRASQPLVSIPPAHTLAMLGASATLRVTPSGPAPFVFEWSHRGIPLRESDHTVGTATSVLTLLDARSEDRGEYEVRIRNACGEAQSGSATLTIGCETERRILAQPTSLSVAAGAPAEFSVTAEGCRFVRYQWFFNSRAITGATEPRFTIAATTPSSAGIYTVSVTDTMGVTLSEPATLDLPPPVLRGLSRGYRPSGTEYNIEWYTLDSARVWVEYGPTEALGRTTAKSGFAKNGVVTLVHDGYSASYFYWVHVEAPTGERYRAGYASFGHDAQTIGSIAWPYPDLTLGLYPASPLYNLADSLVGIPLATLLQDSRTSVTVDPGLLSPVIQSATLNGAHPVSIAGSPREGQAIPWVPPGSMMPRPVLWFDMRQCGARSGSAYTVSIIAQAQGPEANSLRYLGGSFLRFVWP